MFLHIFFAFAILIVMYRRNANTASYLRNFIFGVEDSLSSTVGLLSGVAIAGMEARAILVTGFVVIFVEAFSMAAGSFLAEESAEEYLAARGKPHYALALGDGVIMFFSYFLSGFIPIFPYLFWSAEAAFIYSIGFSLLGLFLFGAAGAWFSHGRIMRSGFRMLIVGGIAIVAGIVVGTLVDGL